MRKILLTVFSLVLTICVFATGQISDKIIYKGEKYSLNTNPLESFFEKNPNRKPNPEIISTALWRGYIATFEIQNDQLFVNDIIIMEKDTLYNHDDTKWISVLNLVFPEQKQVKVDWLTGLLVIPTGKLVNYIHMGYASTYENYILLEIEKGNLVKGKSMNSKEYEIFKDKQFKAFQKTEKYLKLKEDLKKMVEVQMSSLIHS